MTSERLSGGMSVSLAPWCLGMTSCRVSAMHSRSVEKKAARTLCPLESGEMSRKANVLSLLYSVCDGILPSMILQKMQSAILNVGLLLNALAEAGLS